MVKLLYPGILMELIVILVRVITKFIYQYVK